MKTNKPKYFSDQFQIEKFRLKELGVFDPILNVDSRLFIEPALLQYSSSNIIRNSYQTYRQRFTKIFDALSACEREGDFYWTIAEQLVRFPEYKYTCIGYGKTIDGRGSEKEFNRKILEALYVAIKKCKDYPDLFLFAPYLGKGIGGDRVSDMVQNIIDEEVCDYTTDIMQKLSLEGDTNYFSINLRRRYRLIKNPLSNQVIKFLPTDILRDMTVSDKAADICDEIMQSNHEIRSIAGRTIGEVFFEANKADRKKRILDQILLDDELFIKVLQAIKDYNVTQYDLENDPKGLHRWLKDVKDLLSKTQLFKIGSKSGSYEAVINSIGSVIGNFKSATEDEGFWSLFWTKVSEKEFRHASESYAQSMFSYLCLSSLKSDEVKVSNLYKGNETITKVTFEGKNIFIHVKHSDNTQLKSGYEKVLEEAKKSPSDKHLYLIVNFKEENTKQLNEVKIIENEICKIYHINAAIQANVDNVRMISFDGLDISKLNRDRQKFVQGAKIRHEKTDTIKHHVIKPIFTAKKQTGKSRKVSEIANSIVKELQDLEKVNLEAFAKKYSIADLTHLEDMMEYLSSKEDGGQISEWCYQLSQGKF